MAMDVMSTLATWANLSRGCRGEGGLRGVLGTPGLVSEFPNMPRDRSMR